MNECEGNDLCKTSSIYYIRNEGVFDLSILRYACGVGVEQTGMDECCAECVRPVRTVCGDLNNL